jgi:predicted O-methyltransferase YrrM
VTGPDADSLAAYLDEVYRRGNVRTPGGDSIGLAPHSIEREQGEAMRELAVAEGAERTIEVGLALGMSALFLCQAVIVHGGSHVAIDPFQEASWKLAGVRALADAGVRELVEVIEEESQIALPRLVAEGREFDLAFIDGDHRFESVLLDLYYMTRLVRPRGLLVVDDMWMPSIRTAVSYIEKNMGLALEPEALADGFRWRRRPLVACPPAGAAWRSCERRRSLPTCAGTPSSRPTEPPGLNSRAPGPVV